MEVNWNFKNDKIRIFYWIQKKKKMTQIKPQKLANNFGIHSKA